MKPKQPKPTNYAIWAEYYGERIKKMCDEAIIKNTSDELYSVKK